MYRPIALALTCLFVGAPAAEATTRETKKRREAVAFVKNKLGTWYQYGGTGPRYDCSGLVFAAYRKAGMAIPRTTGGQLAGMKRVSRRSLRPGDLVFESSGHVAMRVGGGRVIEAAKTGTQVRYRDGYGVWAARTAF